MKLFLDTADVNEVKKRLSTGLISGITTNPTLIFKSGKHPQDVYWELIKLGVKDVSMEVVGDNEEDLYSRAMGHVKTYGEHATIKVPCSVDGLNVCRRLSTVNVRVNVTLIFSPAQAILASLAGAYYISPFIGRHDDIGHDGLNLIAEIRSIYDNYPDCNTQILAASIRHPWYACIFIPQA